MKEADQTQLMTSHKGQASYAAINISSLETGPIGANVKFKEFLPLAVPAQKLEACFNTLQNVIYEFSEGQSKISERNLLVLSYYKEFIKSKYHDPHLLIDQEFSNRVVKTTCAMLGLLIQDDMKPKAISSPGKTQYLREGYLNDFRELPLPKMPQKTTESLDNESQLVMHSYFMTVQEFIRLQQKASWIQDLNFMSFEDIQNNLNRIDIDMNPNLEPKLFCLKDNYIGLLNLIPNKENEITNNVLRKILYPLSEIPRQEIWNAFLDKGKTLFSRDFPNHLINKLDLLDNWDQMTQYLTLEEKDYFNQLCKTLREEGKYKLLEARKAKIWINSHDETQKLDKFLSNHKVHYSRVLGREHSYYGEPRVFLTRSGVSANGAVIEAIAEYYKIRGFGLKPKSLILPGFYYESNRDIESKFSESIYTGEADDNTVFILTYEPCDADTNLQGGYEQNRENLIDGIKEKAKSNPNNPTFLICDKTTNPLYATFQSGEVLPKNLHIFETFSLTKHQRGGRNFFFGGILYWGDSSLNPLIEQGIIDKRGLLTPLGIIHMPRVTKGELQNNLKHMQELGSHLERTLQQEQREFNEDERWRLENYSYYGFLIPPNNHNTSNDLGKILFKMSEDNLEDTIEAGNSFGLSQTRLMSYKSFNNAFESLRLSYGLDTTPEQLTRFIQKAFYFYSQ